jgi:hypothetical protein
MARVPVSDKILARAQELTKCSGSLGDRDLAKLRQIISGKVKSIGSEWWREIHRAVNRRRMNKASRLAKLSPNKHERHAALAALDRLDASPPGLEEYDRQQAQRFAADPTAGNCNFQGLFDDFMPEAEQ